MLASNKVLNSRLNEIEEILFAGVSPWRQNGFVPSKLHRMAARTGSFPPALANYLINNFSKTGDVVLDVFSGKGTTLLEAVLLGRRALGCDISEEAFILSKAKAKPISKTIANSYIRSKESVVKSESLKVDLKKIPNTVAQFYHPSTLRKLIATFKVFNTDRVCGIPLKKRAAYHALGCLIGILHGPCDIHLSLRCSHAYSMSPKYVRRYISEYQRTHPGNTEFEAPNRDVIDCLVKKSDQVALDSEAIDKLSTRGCDAYRIGAKDFDPHKNRSNTIDLIVTSPPYLAAQTYPWDNWLRLWFLGHKYQDVHKEMRLVTENEKKYKEEMKCVFGKMFSVLKPRGLAFVIVGDVKKRYQKDHKYLFRIVNLAEILIEDAWSVGFSVIKLLRDTIPRSRRSTFTFHNGEAGTLVDRIVCLQKPFSS